jgi:hypothetical protein
MKYAKDVRDYIVTQRNVHKESLMELSNRLRLPYTTVATLYDYEAGIRNGTLTVISKREGMAEEQITLHDCFTKSANPLTEKKRRGGSVKTTRDDSECLDESHSDLGGGSLVKSKTIQKRKNSLTDEEEALILQLYNEAHSVSGISQKIGRGSSLIKRTLVDKYGIVPRKTKQIVSIADRKNILERLAAGESKIALSFELGYTPDIIDCFLLKLSESEKE